MDKRRRHNGTATPWDMWSRTSGTVTPWDMWSRRTHGTVTLWDRWSTTTSTTHHGTDGVVLLVHMYRFMCGKVYMMGISISCECCHNQERVKTISQKITARTRTTTKTFKNSCNSYNGTFTTTKKKQQQDVLEKIPEEDDGNTRNGGTTPAVEISGLLENSEPMPITNYKLTIQEQDDNNKGESPVTTFDSFRNSDVFFSEEQQKDSSLKKWFLNATKADFHKTKNRKWQF